MSVRLPDLSLSSLSLAAFLLVRIVYEYVSTICNTHLSLRCTLIHVETVQVGYIQVLHSLHISNGFAQNIRVVILISDTSIVYPLVQLFINLFDELPEGIA